MLRVGEKYTKQFGTFGRLVFDILSNNREELETFINQNPDTIGFHSIAEDNGDVKFTMFDEKHELAQALVRRFNLEKLGQRQEADRVEFIDQFGTESIKAIAYATDLVPAQMDIDNYSSLVFAAFEQYGASPEFDHRVLELIAAETVEQHHKSYVQLQLLRQLLFTE